MSSPYDLAAGIRENIRVAEARLARLHRLRADLIFYLSDELSPRDIATVFGVDEDLVRMTINNRRTDGRLL